jgi:D-3-phosphoglycerate dehydrogenase
MDRMLRGPIHAMRTLTLGIVGLGRIGQKVASRMAGSVAEVIVSDPYIDQAAEDAVSARLVDLEELMLNADIISLHCPLTPETRGLIGRECLGLVKRTTYLVNTARGPIVDLEALAEALEQDRLAGAALDVVYPEPLPLESRLNALPNVILTPHAAYYSEESVETVRRETLQGVIDVMLGVQPRVIANPDVLNLRPLRPRA